ncbi:2-chlorobenzoate 1,2-dioxygenase, alpha subunit [Klebsiella pneumoniae]|nr:2-chlorobenzoate 1,2-dioxygenase, alpha subunit [Klebsiella pneumoniae]
MQKTLSTLKDKINNALVVDRENHIYRCHRSIFTDPQLFEFEMKHIFEGNWVFLAHESQIPQPGDYYTLTLGRQPVIITRDKKNELHALINSCAHRGAMLCRRKTGNKNSFTCPFHGWTFSNNGKLLKAKDESTGGYPPSFKQDGSHDLQKLPRFQSYRGFLFGSLKADVQPLEAYLGETCKIIDLIVDQAPEGLEVLKGSSSYVYEGNWKLGAENGADGYHVSVVHWNYASTMSRRNYEAEGTHAVDANGWSKSLGGGYGFDNGHMLLWTRALNPEVRPVYAHRERLQAEFGERRADQMVNETRNLCLYPNVYLMDQFSTQIRVIRPLRWIKPKSPSGALRRKGNPTRPERCVSASTRISLTSVEWGRRTTSKSSAPVSAAFSAKICHGATSAAARCAGSMARMSMRNMPAFRRG